MSSLAAQLAQHASLNSALLVDRSRRKPTSSYLFADKEADQHDLESIYALAVNAFIQLSSISPSLRSYEDQLFSDQAKATDRTLLSTEANDELDEAIGKFLALLGPHLMEAPAGRVVEWLVRRFRINEFNLDATLSLFLPYHESPHFAKMVTILHIKPNTLWDFLLPYKSAGQTLSRVSLVTEMLRNSDVARFVASLLPSAIKEGSVHRVQLAFNAATLHEFIKRSKSLDEGTLAYLIPALLEPLQQKTPAPTKDAILGSYILLAALSQKYQIAAPALKVIVGGMARCAHQVSTKQFLGSLVAVCEPQSELECFSDKTIKALLRISGINDEISIISSWIGVEKVLTPLINALSHKLADERALFLMETIIVLNNVPEAIFAQLASLLMKDVISSESAGPTTFGARRLLSLVHQRHPTAISSVADDLCQQDETTKSQIEQLILSFFTVDGISKPAESHEVDLIIASNNAEAKVRTIAVKNILSSPVAGESSTNPEYSAMRSALIARVQDSDAQVLESLYEHPSILNPILLSDPEAYIDSLANAIAYPGSKPKRNILRLHLSYLTAHFLNTASSEILQMIFDRILFPFLLFSKSRQHTAELFWDVLSQNFGASDSAPIFELLAGCADVVKDAKAQETSVDSMSRVNFAVAARIAENIMRSNTCSVHQEALIKKLQDLNPHVKVMGYLIAGALLGLLSGSHQLAAACKVLQVMNFEELRGIDDMPENETLLNFFGPSFLGNLIVTKPSSKTTIHWLQISLVNSIVGIPQPTGVILDWLKDSSKETVQESDQYIYLMREVYNLSNISTTLPILASNLLQTLFVNLKSDALAFLAGIWCTVESIRHDLRSVALLHAAAFLEAHLLEDDGLDFQTILPSLLVSLQCHDLQTRQGALECISRLRLLANRKLVAVYRFDTIYGQSDRILQYLGQEDLTKYLDALVEHRDHFTNDASYITIFHAQHLAKIASGQKKNNDYKRRVLSFLLSHINALSSQGPQTTLLKSLEAVTDKSKVEVLLPTIQSLASSLSSSRPEDALSSYSQDLTMCLLAVFNTSSAKDLNDTNKTVWKTFTSLIRSYFRSGMPPWPQELIATGLENGLFTSLDHERKIEIYNLFLEIGAQDPSYTSCRRLLANILQDVPLMIHLLSSLAPVASDGGLRASKRAKTTDLSDDTIPRLTLLVEILGTKSLPGSLDLISHLLETLNRVVQSISPNQADVSYVEQLLMSAVDSAASKIVEAPNLSPSTIRLDILVEVIRVAENPQTFHQALLLMASLARLAPDSVLHNVMPVFTFMGSNVFHRDDAYSFKVVQQTIDSIVPVMAASLKQSHSQGLDLFIGAKDSLRVFTDAANHVPRHRRNNFFAHLVDVLGSIEFLAPTCMLLIEKAANRIVRQKPDEIRASLALPIALIQHQEYQVQVSSLNEILQESQRLAARIYQPEIISPLFLEGGIDADHLASSSTILRRRAQALITFIGYAIKSTPQSAQSSEDSSISSVVSNLLTLATLKDVGKSADTKVDEISQAARNSISRLLESMSAVTFIDSVLAILEQGDAKVLAGTLELLSDRLPNITPKARAEVTPAVNKIIVSIRNIITKQKDDRVLIFSFKALRSIASTLCPAEEGPLAGVVQGTLAAVKDQSLAPSALSALASMSPKLGPRIIPFFRAIITQCVVTLHQGNKALAESTLAILQGLLSSIPTFWGSEEVTQIVNFYIEDCFQTSNVLSSATSGLMKSVAKRIPAKILLPTLLELWAPLEATVTVRIEAYFDLLARALRNADRASISEHLRALSKVFLVALSIVKEDIQGQTFVIAAFKELVIKLNEAAFKPLFRRLYDWAFAGEVDPAQQATFIRLYNTLLDFFKNLMNPYMTLLLPALHDTLKAFTTQTCTDFILWDGVIQTITKSLSFDDGSFWRDDKLQQISILLVEQVEVTSKLNDADAKRLLQDCLGVLIEAVTDDTLLKKINLNILMHTRSEDSRSRLTALTFSEALWRTHGGKLLGFVAETTTFIAECSEDENDMVVKESFRLKDAVESVAGKIDGL